MQKIDSSDSIKKKKGHWVGLEGALQEFHTFRRFNVVRSYGCQYPMILNFGENDGKSKIRIPNGSDRLL